MKEEREVRKETGWLGNEIEVIYENGRRVGEVRTEEHGGFLGMGAHDVRVEFDNDMQVTSYVEREVRGGSLGIGTEEHEIRRDSSGVEIGHSRVESKGGLLGMGEHHVRVEYDNEHREISQSSFEKRGGLLGVGSESVRVTRHSGPESTHGFGSSRSSIDHGSGQFDSRGRVTEVTKESNFSYLSIDSIQLPKPMRRAAVILAPFLFSFACLEISEHLQNNPPRTLVGILILLLFAIPLTLCSIPALIITIVVKSLF